MKLNVLTMTAATLTAFALAGPASAQDDHARHRNPQSAASSRSGDNRAQSTERAQPRQETQRETHVQAPGVAPRPPRVEAQPAPSVQAVAPHVEGRAVPRASVQTVQPNYSNHNYSNNNYNNHNNYRPNYRPDYHPNYRPGYAPYYGHTYPVYRPYVFRPQYHLRFGVYVGYPVTYGYTYAYPIPVYGYGAPPRPVVVGPGSQYYGGIALEISPDDAAVYVDGNYAGIVRDFDGSTQPLTLTSGVHHIQVETQGYQPLQFDVTVQPGMVVPYQGSMQAY